MEKPTKPFAIFTKQFAVAHGLKLALGNGVHWEYSRTHDPAQSVELRRKQAIADGPFCSEEDAAVGKTDCTPMLKLVPFVRHTAATCVGEIDRRTKRVVANLLWMGAPRQNRFESRHR